MLTQLLQNGTYAAAASGSSEHARSSSVCGGSAGGTHPGLPAAWAMPVAPNNATARAQASRKCFIGGASKKSDGSGPSSQRGCRVDGFRKCTMANYLPFCLSSGVCSRDDKRSSIRRGARGVSGGAADAAMRVHVMGVQGGEAGVASIGLVALLGLAALVGFVARDFKDSLAMPVSAFLSRPVCCAEHISVNDISDKRHRNPPVSNPFKRLVVRGLSQTTEALVLSVSSSKDNHGDLPFRRSFDVGKVQPCLQPNITRSCRPEILVTNNDETVTSKGAIRNDADFVHQDVGSLGEANRIALVREGAIGHDASDSRNDGENPIGPDWRTSIAPPGLFVLAAGLLGAGSLFAYRLQFIRDRPDVAFSLLVCYGLAVLGLVRVLYDHVS
jgi:hypothetical protein